MNEELSTDYAIKLDIFEGPLDLLLYLIKKNEIDIYNIPVALITQQYLDYLDSLRNDDAKAVQLQNDLESLEMHNEG